MINEKMTSHETAPLNDNGLPEVSLHDNAVLLDELPDARELVVPVLAHQLCDTVPRTVQSTVRLSVYVQFVEVLYCKRTIQCLASSELLTPHPPTPPGECVSPAFGAGGGHTRWVERGLGVNSSEDARHCSVLYLCKYCRIK
jgi:hypothetical protein